MADFQTMFTFYLTAIAEFLLKEPIVYLTALMILTVIVGIVIKIIKACHA